MLIRVCHGIEIAFPLFLGHFDLLRMTMTLHEVLRILNLFLTRLWLRFCSQSREQMQVDV